MDMTERVERLEAIAEKTTAELHALALDVAVIKATCATKAELAELRAEVKAELASMKENGATKKDLAEMKASIVMWVVTAIFLAQLLPSLLGRLGL